MVGASGLEGAEEDLVFVKLYCVGELGDVQSAELPG